MEISFLKTILFSVTEKLVETCDKIMSVQKCLISFFFSEKLNERGSKPFFELLNSVGKFPALDNSWNETDFRLEDILIKLTRHGNSQSEQMCLHLFLFISVYDRVSDC